MTTRTSVKNLVWETYSGGFPKARAQKELEMVKATHPNHYVRIKRYAVGSWEVQMARKPHMGKKRVTETKIGSPVKANRDSRRDSWYVRGRGGKGY